MSEHPSPPLMEPRSPASACPQRAWLAAGLVLILLGLALGVAVRGDRVVPGELSFLQWLHQPPSEELDRVAWAASRLGDTRPWSVGVTIVVTLWCAWRRRLDLALFVVIASTSDLLNTPLKWLFDSARPPLDLHAIFETASGFGYPSGHTSGAVLVFGATLLAVPLTLQTPAARWAVRVVCLALMVLVPWSRMRLGVHWPSDVAGGYLFGWGMLAVLWALLPCLWERMPAAGGFDGKPR